MRKETFTKDGRTFERVTKPTAKKHYLAGGCVYLFPVNANTSNPFSFWGVGYPVDYENRKQFFIDEIGASNDFDSVINSFMYYNCNSETGTTAKYFVKKEG